MRSGTRRKEEKNLTESLEDWRIYVSSGRRRIIIIRIIIMMIITTWLFGRFVFWRNVDFNGTRISTDGNGGYTGKLKEILMT